MDVFQLRDQLVDDYADYVRSFISIRDPRARQVVDESLDAGLLWPEARIGLNPAFALGGRIEDLVDRGLLHPGCSGIFRLKPDDGPSRDLRLHAHQAQAIEAAATGSNYVLTTGTGSGKSLAYLVPIVDAVLRRGSGHGIAAIVVYPMNALANSQGRELEKFLCRGFPAGQQPVTFARYTGQESERDKAAVIARPPDILLTNYVMLELLLTRLDEVPLIRAARHLRFLVLDELHTYRGRQGADVALLARRTRLACGGPALQMVGTSATMAGGGSPARQRVEVARVATLLFGARVEPSHVIVETLRRVTDPVDLADPVASAALRRRLTDPAWGPPAQPEAFVADPLSSWLESTFGVAEAQPEEGHPEDAQGEDAQPEEARPGAPRLVRAVPRTIGGPGGAAAELAAVLAVDEETAAGAIRRHLLAGHGIIQPDTGFPLFAFRLHQFISRGDTLYASPEAEDTRHLTLKTQSFVPGDRHRALLPLVFCRECGQDYYSVARVHELGQARLVPRELSGGAAVEEDEGLYLYLSAQRPWTEDPVELHERLPEDWIEETATGRRVKSDHRRHLPRAVTVAPDGGLAPAGSPGSQGWLVPAPFRFCLACGVTHGARQRSDLAKLATLGSGGRSTATTLLSLSAVRALRSDRAHSPRSRKLLCFSDNRQDASLQAGHFNDFVQIGLLRSALYRAVRDRGGGGLAHDELTLAVFSALELPLSHYAADPGVRFVALSETERALRDVLGYHLYLDLRRGWRITSPNLEQTGLLRIAYASLDEVCRASDVWERCHPALSGASAAQRQAVSATLLDTLRRELAIKVDYLEEAWQERLSQVSAQRLRSPWALDENERLEHAAIAYPRSSGPGDYGGAVYLSGRGGFGQYLRRTGTFPDHPGRLKVVDTEAIIPELLEGLRVAGLVERVAEPKAGVPARVPGYQVPAAALRWTVGDGSSPVDPVRTPRPPAGGRRPNSFFQKFYDGVAADGAGLEAREHTAQVPSEVRQEREERFRSAELPVLFCSPTMELGVDIAELNVVAMRNVPPTPANYAQRSGRAGRSGQPALVVTYCSAGSAHDRYFFARPDQMVAGAVAPPRLDLANEDLVRAHVQALWLSAARLSLHSSLTEVLDVAGDHPSLALLDHVSEALARPAPRAEAEARAVQMLADLVADGVLDRAGWWTPTWLAEALAGVALRFEAATERWRDLYRAALGQAEAQNRIIHDAKRAPADRMAAERLRREAVAQLDLLRADVDRRGQADFYSYRYFAAEGFLPGYSFPRLPLSAFIPGRRQASGNDEFLSRPRFLAVSEFGPRNLVYHEGSRYEVNRVILPVSGAGADPADQVLTRSAKICTSCSYLHPLAGQAGPDLCESCGAALPLAMGRLFRLQNVVTRRRDRINSDEEERQRQGYEVRSALRFAGHGPLLGQARLPEVAARGLTHGGEATLAELAYGHAATLWRINQGWRRRRADAELGFVLDTERGYWGPRPDAGEATTAATRAGGGGSTGPLDPHDMGARRLRVIPYVEDTRNCLVIEPAGLPADERQRQATMASLQAALRTAIQVGFQLEETELAAEPLPARDDRRRLLFYESAEGGAGVLRRLLEDPGALARVARAAIDLCHVDPDTGEERAAAPVPACEAACYDCLLSYTNQADHRLLDRRLALDHLFALARGVVASGASGVSRPDQLDRLGRFAGSELEHRFLALVDVQGYRLPGAAQHRFSDIMVEADFVYPDSYCAVFVDGPVHDPDNARRRDEEVDTALRGLGWEPLRFRYDQDWEAKLAARPDVFGPGRPRTDRPGLDAPRPGEPGPVSPAR